MSLSRPSSPSPTRRRRRAVGRRRGCCRSLVAAPQARSAGAGPERHGRRSPPGRRRSSWTWSSATRRAGPCSTCARTRSRFWRRASARRSRASSGSRRSPRWLPKGRLLPRQPDSTRQLSLVTLVFDQLGETGRRQAQRAAEAFLEKGLRANTYAAVFRVDQRLSMVQAFTTDRAKLKDAVAALDLRHERGRDRRESRARAGDGRAAADRGARKRYRTRGGEPGSAASPRARRPRRSPTCCGMAERAAAPADGNHLALPADGARQGPADARGPQDAALPHRGSRGPAQPRSRLPLRDKLGGQPRQRERLHDRRARPERPSRRWRARATPCTRRSG